MVKEIIVKNIQWDTEGKKVRLPKKVVIKNPSVEMLEEIEDGEPNIVCDYLIDNYRFFVDTFDIEIDGETIECA